jgi:putative endonuclease
MKIKSTTNIGQNAEGRVADLLSKSGFKILSRNWRLKVCEIDIVAIKDEIIYFFEVKYRSTENQGSGFDYITSKKIKQMQYAAEIWVLQNKWDGDYRIAAAEVSDAANTIKVVEVI